MIPFIIETDNFIGGRCMFFLYVILAVILVFAISTLIRHFQQKKYVNVLTQDELIKGYRKAQLLDIREPQEFERVYNRRLRNLLLTQMKQRLVELRTDKPVYSYGQSNNRSKRAAHPPHKRDYQDLYILDGGFKKWTGKVDVKYIKFTQKKILT